MRTRIRVVPVVLLAAISAACVSAPPTQVTHEIADEAETMVTGNNRDFELTLETSAEAKAIWARWTNVPGWPSWDRELVSAEIEGSFLENAKGSLRANGSPPSTFVVREVVPDRSYIIDTRLPLATLSLSRHLESSSDGTRFTHRVSFSGPMAPLFAAILGPRFRKALPGAMMRLREQAEAATSAPVP